jgi:hypothetical protein
MDTIKESKLIEEYSRDITFHFNKKFLEDQTIPMWTVKSKGQTYYVNHLTSKVGFSTKETPDNTSTKGAIKLRGKLTMITYDDGDVEALVE